MAVWSCRDLVTGSDVKNFIADGSFLLRLINQKSSAAGLKDARLSWHHIPQLGLTVAVAVKTKARAHFGCCFFYPSSCSAGCLRHGHRLLGLVVKVSTLRAAGLGFAILVIDYNAFLTLYNASPWHSSLGFLYLVIEVNVLQIISCIAM